MSQSETICVLPQNVVTRLIISNKLFTNFDTLENTLYWCEDDDGLIRSVNFDGSSIQTLYSTTGNYYGITLINGQLFFTEQGDG